MSEEWKDAEVSADMLNDYNGRHDVVEILNLLMKITGIKLQYRNEEKTDSMNLPYPITRFRVVPPTVIDYVKFKKSSQ